MATGGRCAGVAVASGVSDMVVSLYASASKIAQSPRVEQETNAICPDLVDPQEPLDRMLWNVHMLVMIFLARAGGR